MGKTSQFPPVLFSCSRFLNSADPTRSLEQAGPEYYVIITRLECKQKIRPMHFEFAYFYFVPAYSFGTETINTLIHVSFHSFLENHTPFHTKMGIRRLEAIWKNGAPDSDTQGERRRLPTSQKKKKNNFSPPCKGVQAVLDSGLHTEDSGL